LAEEYNIAVEGRAFLLRPDTPKEGAARNARPGETDTELAEPLRGYANEAGLIMRPPPKTPNTLYALEATEYAQQQGKFLEFHRAAYRALWEDGRDLGDLAVIEEIGDEVSLDSGELIKSLEGQQHSTTVMEQYQEALKHGINGIPTFLVGNLLFTGAHPYNIFQAAMQRVLQAE
jgi:predicted DsbA family dithiol-disulfide isomerase